MPGVSLRMRIQRIVMMWHFGVDDIIPRSSRSKVRLCLSEFS